MHAQRFGPISESIPLATSNGIMLWERIDVKRWICSSFGQFSSKASTQVALVQDRHRIRVSRFVHRRHFHCVLSANLDFPARIPSFSTGWSQSVLLIRIRHCFAIATLLISGIVAAGEPVIVELKSGRLLQAQAIESDSASPERVVLSIQKPSMQMRRSVAWDQISRLTAPPAQLAAMHVPEGVQVSDHSADSEWTPIASRSTVLIDGIPPSPTATSAQSRRITRTGAIFDYGCPPMLRDPGVIVGVRDWPCAVRTCEPVSVTAPRP